MCLRVTTLVTFSAEAKEMYRPKQRAAGSEAVYQQCTGSIREILERLHLVHGLGEAARLLGGELDQLHVYG